MMSHCSRGPAMGSLEAAVVIGSLANSLLASNQSLKIVEEEESSVIISDVMELLHHLDIEHPVGQIIRGACQAHHDVHGTSTNTLLCLIGIWTKSVIALTNQGIPVSDIVKLLHAGIDRCVEHLNIFHVPVEDLNCPCWNAENPDAATSITSGKIRCSRSEDIISNQSDLGVPCSPMSLLAVPDDGPCSEEESDWLTPLPGEISHLAASLSMLEKSYSVSRNVVSALGTSDEMGRTIYKPCISNNEVKSVTINGNRNDDNADKILQNIGALTESSKSESSSFPCFTRTFASMCPNASHEDENESGKFLPVTRFSSILDTQTTDDDDEFSDCFDNAISDPLKIVKSDDNRVTMTSEMIQKVEFQPRVPSIQLPMKDIDSSEENDDISWFFDDNEIQNEPQADANFEIARRGKIQNFEIGELTFNTANDFASFIEKTHKTVPYNINSASPPQTCVKNLNQMNGSNIGSCQGTQSFSVPQNSNNSNISAVDKLNEILNWPSSVSLANVQNSSRYFKTIQSTVDLNCSSDCEDQSKGCLNEFQNSDGGNRESLMITTSEDYRYPLDVTANSFLSLKSQGTDNFVPSRISQEPVTTSTQRSTISSDVEAVMKTKWRSFNNGKLQGSKMCSRHFTRIDGDIVLQKTEGNRLPISQPWTRNIIFKENYLNSNVPSTTDGQEISTSERFAKLPGTHQNFEKPGESNNHFRTEPKTCPHESMPYLGSHSHNRTEDGGFPDSPMESNLRLSCVRTLVHGLSHGCELAECLLLKVLCLQNSGDDTRLSMCQTPRTIRFEVDSLHSCTLVGPSESKSCVVEGLLTKVSPSQLAQIHASQEDKIYKTVLINGDLKSVFKHKGYKAPVNIQPVYTAQAYTRPMQSYTQVVLTNIRRLGVDVILVRGSVDPDVQLICESTRVIVLERAPHTLLEAVCKCCSGTMATYLEDCSLEDVCELKLSVWDANWLLKCYKKADDYILIMPVSSQPAQSWTAVICHPCADIARRTQAQLWKCAKRLDRSLETRYVLQGAGNCEGRAANHLSSMTEQCDEQASRDWSFYTKAVFVEMSCGFRRYHDLVLTNMKSSITQSEEGKFTHSKGDKFPPSANPNLEVCGQNLIERATPGYCGDTLSCGEKNNDKTANQCCQSSMDVACRAREQVTLLDDVDSKVSAWQTAIDIVCTILQCDYHISTGSGESSQTNLL